MVDDRNYQYTDCPGIDNPANQFPVIDTPFYTILPSPLPPSLGFTGTTHHSSTAARHDGLRDHEAVVVGAVTRAERRIPENTRNYQKTKNPTQTPTQTYTSHDHDILNHKTHYHVWHFYRAVF